MSDPSPSPLMGISRLQLAVSVGLLLMAILGPFTALLIQINSLSERQAQTNMRLDKIEVHNAETEKRFDTVNADHAVLSAKILQMQTRLCDHDQKLCDPPR